MTPHNAPPVVYPLGYPRFHGYFLLGLWLAGFLLVVSWIYGVQALDWRSYLALTATVLAGMAAYRGWKNSPVGRLCWDGQAWHWKGTGYMAGVTEHKLAVIADFQNLLLLRLENPAHAYLWLWAERGVMPERWLDLRRAVYTPHKIVRQALKDDQPAQDTMQAVAVSRHDLSADMSPKP